MGCRPGRTSRSAPSACASLPPQVRPSKTSKAFWEAMGRLQTHLTDAKKIAAYNARKEQKLKVGRWGAWCCCRNYFLLCSARQSW